MKDLPTITHVPASPGAAYVVQCEDWLPERGKEHLVQRLVSVFGADPSRVFVLDGGMDLSVIGLEDQRRVPDLLAANNRLHHRNVNLTCGLISAAATFREYVGLHDAKGTVEGAAKAQANLNMATRLEAIMSENGSPGPSQSWLAERCATLKDALDDLLRACVADFGSPDGEEDGEAVSHGQTAAGAPILPSAVTFGHLRRAQVAIDSYWTQPESPLSAAKET